MTLVAIITLPCCLANTHAYLSTYLVSYKYRFQVRYSGNKMSQRVNCCLKVKRHAHKRVGGFFRHADLPTCRKNGTHVTYIVMYKQLIDTHGHVSYLLGISRILLHIITITGYHVPFPRVDNRSTIHGNQHPIFTPLITNALMK